MGHRTDGCHCQMDNLQNLQLSPAFETKRRPRSQGIGCCAELSKTPSVLPKHNVLGRERVWNPLKSAPHCGRLDMNWLLTLQLCRLSRSASKMASCLLQWHGLPESGVRRQHAGVISALLLSANEQPWQGAETCNLLGVSVVRSTHSRGQI
mgnify:FL=1